MARLTENSTEWGIFEYGTDHKYRSFDVRYNTGSEEAPYNNISLHISKWLLRIRFFNIIPPWRIKVFPTSWSKEDIERIGRDYYWEVKERQFGFHFLEDNVQILYGKQDWEDSKRKLFWLPWKQWRFVRFSLYDLEGKDCYTLLESEKKKQFKEAAKMGLSFWDTTYYKEEEFAKKNCPKVDFTIKDYDGQIISVTTHIEEREWHFGEKYFKWLSLFRKPLIRRDLSIEYSDEVGREKGSWKGGTVGCSIEMLPGELHESAMKRHCEKEHRSKHGTYKIEFVGPGKFVPRFFQTPDTPEVSNQVESNIKKN